MKEVVDVVVGDKKREPHITNVRENFSIVSSFSALMKDMLQNSPRVSTRPMPMLETSLSNLSIINFF